MEHDSRRNATTVFRLVLRVSALAIVLIFNYLYSEAQQIGGTLAAVRYNGAWGYIDPQANVQIPFQYNFAQRLKGWAVVRQTGQPLFQVIAANGSAVSKNGFEEIRRHASGNFAVKLNGLWGAMNAQGILKLPHKYADLYVSDNNLFTFQQNGKWGLINAQQQVIAPTVYDSPIWLIDGLGSACRSGVCGLLDNQGNEIGSFDYAQIGQVSEGYCSFKPKGGTTFGFLKSDGSVGIAPAFDAARAFHENLAAVSKSGKWGYVDRFGFWFVQPQYDEALDFRNGWAAVRQGAKWGFINSNGELAISPHYEAVGVMSEGDEYFSQGLQPVQLNGRWGFIDTKGQVVVQFLYHMVMPYQNGFAAVQLNGRWGFIDAKGKLTIPPIYESVSSFMNTISK